MENFKQLIENIKQIHQNLQKHATSAVNQALTIRNWLIGFYIVEFEQNGEDRAVYGVKLLAKLAASLQIKGLTEPELSRCRQFYQNYPQILGTLSQNFRYLLPHNISVTLSQKSEIEQKKTSVSPEKLLSSLSYSHFTELIKLDDPLKRIFYELECIKGTWSVRELRRQMNSLYFERSGLSKSPEKLSEQINRENIPQAPIDIIKNIYAFEFLELDTKNLVEESDLETALLDHLQQFILELGNGFCFEARQKRILIGDEYFFVDLVFYHRILKCHVLIDLKIGAFQHGDIGQLNTYLNYFKEELSAPADNPPAGILLVAQKNHALVKYATAGMDQNLFVQQYLVKLPGKEQLERYIETELKKRI
jgi:predicted nuclease of restriction endonuclease-like (RecB) superfamily